MKPQFEQVTVPPGESWSLLWRELPEIPFIWHYHPEFELTLTLNARGQRYVGDHLADFEPGDLVLLGPNQPHTWAAQERLDKSRPMLAVVVWFSPQWLSRLLDAWPELAPISRLAERAGRSLRFSKAVAGAVQPMMLSMRELEPADRLPLLLQVLLMLSRDAGAQPLSTRGTSPVPDKSRDRLDRVLQRLQARIAQPPAIAELAAQASLSVGAFHRFFKRHMEMTVLDYVAQLRVGLACQLLIGSERAIGAIASEVGYASLAHFNRQFLARKGVTPSDFRARYHRGQRRR
jgi:AraC-like DNA-binding protein